MNCCFLSTTITEKLHREKNLLGDLSREWDLGSREQDGIGTELHGTWTGMRQLLAGMGGSGNGKLVPCNTLSVCVCVLTWVAQIITATETCNPFD